MDSFHGCYENTTHDYRHFATLYLAVRFLNLLMSSVFSYILYLPAATLVFVFALVLVAKFQPYKQNRHNTIDIILLLVSIILFIASSMHFSGAFMYAKLLNGITVDISALIILSYQVFLILASVLPKAIQCCKKCKTLLMSKIKKNDAEDIEGDRALLNHGSTDYSSYS
jgi:hypothetical protein